MSGFRFIGGVVALCVVGFAAAFVVGRSGQPEPAAAARVAGLQSLPPSAAPPAIPVLARVDALPAIRVKHKPKRQLTTSTQNQAGISGSGAITGTAGTAGSAGAVGSQGTAGVRTGTNTTNTTNTTKKSGNSGVTKTGSGGSVAGGGTPEG